jgi:hypothetical protein
MFACRKTPRPRKRNLVAPVLSSLLNIPTFKPSNLQTPLCVSPFLATLTDDPQLTENPATLSPVPATLTGRVKHNPFVCHSYTKHRGVGYTLQSKFFSSRNPATLHSPLVYPEASRRATIPCRIRTSAKPARNSRRIRTSKTQDLKPFRMNTYEKTGEGGEGFYLEEHRGASSSFQNPCSRCINIRRD